MFINMTSIKGEQEVSGDLRFIDTEKKYRAADSVDGPSYNLIAAAIQHELILIGLPDCTVVGVKTEKLLKSSPIQDLNNILFSLHLSFKPLLLSVSQHGMGSVLLVAGKNQQNNCPTLQLFNLDTRDSIAKLDVPNQSNSDIVEAEWNPIYHDSIVALCTSSGCLLVLALCKDTKRAGLVYQESKYGALTCSWSPKGKNLAVGMSSGQIMRLEPVITESSFTFEDVSNSTVIPANEAITEDHRIVKLNWLRKKILLCVHAKLNDQNGPETVYSLVSIKPTDPVVYWSNVCSEKCDPNSCYYPLNLNNVLVCASSSSSEVVVLGPKSGQSNTDKIPEWSSILIDEEVCRINLPLDSKNNETLARGFTVTFLSCDMTKPIVFLYTSAGVLCSYICDSTNPLNLPAPLEPQACPVDIPRPVVSEPPPTTTNGRPSENGKPYTIKEEEDGDDGLDLPITPLKSCPRESISQWSVERVKRNMSVKSLVSSMERQRR